MRRTITKSGERFIRRNYLTMTQKEIGRKLGLPAGTVRSFLRREDLQIPREMGTARRLESRNKKLAKEAKKYHLGDSTIKANYLTIPVKTLAAKIGRSHTYLRQRMKELELVVPPEIIEQRKKDSRIKSGNVPKNKGKKQTEFMSPEQIERTKSTRFKKGQAVHNEKYDGAIEIRHEHPERGGGRQIKWIRLSKGKWEQLQIVEWEKVHGKRPKDRVLACKTTDTLNCDPSNWELITRYENLQRNNHGRDNLDDQYIATLLAKGARKKVDQELKAEMVKHPDLIEVKRTQLKVNRLLKKLTNEK